jgi:hypothetical protein
MSRTKLPLSQEHIAPFDLEAFVNTQIPPDLVVNL